MWIVIKVFLITVAFPQSDFSPHIPVLYEEVAGVETVLKLREPASSVQRLQRDPGLGGYSTNLLPFSLLNNNQRVLHFQFYCRRAVFYVSAKDSRLPKK